MEVSQELQTAINDAAALATELRHEFITIEHFFCTLLRCGEIQEIIKACGGDIDFLAESILAYLKEELPAVKETGRVSTPTIALERVLQRAAVHVQSSGKEIVRTGNVLVALFSEKESMAVYLLKKQGITRLDVVGFISHGQSPFHKRIGASPLHEGGSENPEAVSGDQALELFTVNLNEKAAQGKLDPLIGRQNELQRIIQILSRRQKNNPVLVGDAGVGKTAVVEGLAQLIVAEKAPHTLVNCTIYVLDLAALLAGTRYRGDFEERFKAVLKSLREKPGSLLFIDEIHTIIGAGQTSGGTMDASNLLKPVLTSGEIKCIGATTFEEYRKYFINSKALSRRFQKVDVKEPSPDEALLILKGLKSHYEKHHAVVYTDDALEAAVKLSTRYLHDKHLPDKALDVVDEAGAANSILEEKKRKPSLDAHEIEETVSAIAQVPVTQVNHSDKTLLRKTPENLKLLIYGQDKAIEAVTSSIKLSRSGLGTKERPIGCFLFYGPTGVGKTELAKQLALNMGIEFIRFDMSEYMEAHTVSRLIGSPPGYVGFDQGGQLTEAVSKTPHAVVLLDEIEKAHPDIMNILLQVMDYGTLTDNNGKKADFQNVILILTTNVGARDMEKSPIGFAVTESQPDAAAAVKKYFSPEFRNRLDAIVRFNSLDKKIISQVVNKFISELEAQLEAKQISLVVDETAREWIMEKGYDKTLGARPMERFIQQHLRKPLVDEILFGKLENGGEVSVTIKEDALKFKLKPLKIKSERRGKASRRAKVDRES